MASKKFLILAGIFCLLASTSGFSQKMGASYDVKDSSVVRSKDMPQHTEFLNGTYNFPAKPRNQWEIGIKAGLFNISGDVPSVLLTPGFGVHIRKAFGYVFSLRGAFLYGQAKGQHFRSAENFRKNTAWNNNGFDNYGAPLRTAPGPITYVAGPNSTPTVKSKVFYNYKTIVQEVSIEGVVSLNNIRFHKAKSGMNIYGFFGVGGAVYEAKINAVGSDNKKYNFDPIANAPYKDRKTTIDAIKNLSNYDKKYETPGEGQGNRRPKLFDRTFKPTGSVGLGVAFKLTNKINLAIEDRFTFIKDDLLDGQRWQEHPWGDASLTRDFDSYNMFSLGLNINIGSKAVEPLYWLNPLNYSYSEIRNPRLMRLPKPALPDSDADGVTDQFDQEQTPSGCPVDSHGVTKDTDGDGVPDCKDKELITPTYCQPVDADGIGKCPCDPNCVGKAPPVEVKTCSQLLGSLPSVAFKAGNNNLDNDAKAALATVAARLRNNAGCKVVVIGYCASNKKEQQLSWDHVNAVINYMVEKEGISIDRFIFNYGQDGGDCDTVDLRAAAEGEDGPNTVEPPHPNLRKNN